MIGVLLLLGLGNATAASILPNGDWHYFWTDTKTWVDDPYDPNEPPIGHIYYYNADFVVSSAQAIQINITDAFEVGDRYEILVNGESALVTSETDPAFFGWDAPSYNNTNPGDAQGGDAPWADEFLSKGSLFLTAGTYDISIRIANSGPIEGRSGFYRATAIPIPAAIWLFGTCLGLLGWMRRKQTN